MKRIIVLIYVLLTVAVYPAAANPEVDVGESSRNEVGGVADNWEEDVFTSVEETAVWEEETISWEDILVASVPPLIDCTDNGAAYRETVARLNKGVGTGIQTDSHGTYPSSDSSPLNPDSTDSDLEAASTELVQAVLCKSKKELALYDEGLLVSVCGPRNSYVIYYESLSFAEAAVEFYLGQEGIIYAELDEEVEAADPFEDISPLVGEGSEEYMSWGAQRMNLFSFLHFSQSYGEGSSTVAIIDSGVASHSFLDGRIVSLGFDYVDADEDPTNDLRGHGTHVAGIVADCSRGAAVYLLPIRVLDEGGHGKVSNAVSAFEEAIEKKVDVINFSIVTKKVNTALDTAVLEAVSEGITVVAAAGNYQCDASTCSPAHLENMGFLVVGSVEEDGSKASYSNYGQSVDVYCYGSNIYGISKTGEYETGSGTSYAAPHISAVCALVLLLHPELDPVEVEERIVSGCQETEGRMVPDLERMVPSRMNFSLENGLILTAGEKIRMPDMADPSSCLENVTYESSDASVVRVDQGTITAEGFGECLIMASCKGLEEVFRVRVIEVSEDSGGVLFLPENLRTVEEDAFSGCEGVRLIVLKGTVEICGNPFSDAVVISDRRLENSSYIVGGYQ